MARQDKRKSGEKPRGSQKAPRGDIPARIDQLKKMLSQKEDKKSFNYFLKHFSKNSNFMKTAKELCDLRIVHKILTELKNILRTLSVKQADEAEQAETALMESAEIGMIHGCVYGKTFIATLFYLAQEKTGVVGLISNQIEGIATVRFAMDVSPEAKRKAGFAKRVARLKEMALNADDSESALATMKYFDSRIVRKKDFIYYAKPLQESDIARGILTNLADILGETSESLFRRERNPQFLGGRLPESALSLIFLGTDDFRANIFYLEESGFGFIDVSLKTNEYRIVKFYVSESGKAINAPCAPGVQ